MAGMTTPGESPDNPVAINVTAIVDIIFCLCIFFMCSFHFRQLEKKMDCWLPVDRGLLPNSVPSPLVEEVRIFLGLATTRLGQPPVVVRRAGSREARSDGELRALLRNMAANLARASRAKPPVVIDSEPAVPWREVVNVLDLCREEGLGRVEFAAPKS